MTLLRKFEGNTLQTENESIPGKLSTIKQNLYHYDELCDLLSHLYLLLHTDVRAPANASPKELFMFNLRRKQTQWRRVFRKDKNTANGMITMHSLENQLSRHQFPISHANRAMLIGTYAVDKDTPGAPKYVPSASSKRRGSETGDGGRRGGTMNTAPTGKIKKGSTFKGSTNNPNPNADLNVSGTSFAEGSISANESQTLPISPIKIRREALAQSVFPRKPIVDQKLLDTLALEEKEKSYVLDYKILCDDIYELDWLH
jgi:hypothetical protein